MTGVLVAACSTGLGYLAGLAILHRRGLSSRHLHLTALALAPGLAAGALSLTFFFLLHFGLDRRALGGILAALLAALAAAWHRRTAPAAPAPAPEARRAPRWQLLLWILLLSISLYVLAGRCWGELQKNPLGSHDAVAIWNARAALLFRAESDHQEIFRRIERGHIEYPLLLPGSIAAQYVLRGAEDPAIPQTMGVAFLGGLALLIYLGVERLGARRMALPAVVTALSVPAISRFSFTQCADLPVAYLALAAAAGLRSQLPAPRQHPGQRALPPSLAGFFVGLLAWTKDEGTVLAAIFLGVFLLLHVGSLGRPDPRTLGRIAVGGLPCLVALALFKTLWGSGHATRAFLSDIPLRLREADRWQTIAEGLLCQVSPWCRADLWGILWPLLAAGLLLALLRGSQDLRHWYLLSAFAAALIAYLGFYLITPHPVAWHVEKSLDRLLLQLFPLLLVWVFGAIEPGARPGLAPQPPDAHRG